MKHFITIFLLAITSQYFAQTYGIFSENPNLELDGNMATDTTNVVFSIEAGGVTAYTPQSIVPSDSAYFGDEALHIKFDGTGSGHHVKLRALPIDFLLDAAQYPDWVGGEFVFHIKALEPADVSMIVQTYRPDQAGGLHESDELLSAHGFNPNLVDVWQKVYFDPSVIEGRIHDITGYDYIGFRSRGFASNIIVDEVYMDYTEMHTFGIYADSSKFISAGKLSEAPASVDGATIETIQASTIVPGPYGPKGAGEALHVTFAGGGGDRVRFAVPNEFEAYPSWNDVKANLVMYIKLIDTVDIAIEIDALRDGVSINGSDEMLSMHGLDIKNTSEWQRIVIDLADGLEGNSFDYSQFKAFSLRSRDNASDFYVDEVYVRYPVNPTVGVNDKTDNINNIFRLNQNYPNPFNPTTKISFNLKNSGNTILTVYNVIGENVAELINGEMKAGYHEVNFNAGNLSSGIYFYRLESGGISQIQKMILLK